MRKQVINRLGAAHIRDTLQQFIDGGITRFQAMESLQVSKTRLYVLRASYLAAKTKGNAADWRPGLSGGNHMPRWSDEAQKFLMDVLRPDDGAKRYSYAFAASEVGRLHDLFVDRAQVRHWAIEHGIHSPAPKPRPPAHVRRWQRNSIGRRALAARRDARLLPRATEPGAQSHRHARRLQPHAGRRSALPA